MFVSQLFIYPVKSLAGIAVDSAEVQERGFKYDRRWMLVNEQNQGLTQRDLPAMALLSTRIDNGEIHISNKRDTGRSVTIPSAIATGEKLQVKIWNDECIALVAGNEINKWFSAQLGTECKLVYMPDDEQRLVNPKYAHNEEITSFSDAYPILLIGQASLDDLNSRIDENLPMNRFRPNIVFTGGHPYEEDEMEEFTINDISFFGVKLCDRCTVTTINQQTLEKGKEPLKTFSTYRLKDNNVYFGQNLVHKGSGLVRLNDPITIIKKKPPVFPL